VLVQSVDTSPYHMAMGWLANLGKAYPCHLSRTQIDAAASAPQEGAHETPYPASLRPPIAGRPLDFEYPPPGPGSAPGQSPNWRFCTPPGVVDFVDRFAGPQSIDPSQTVGDFVLWTKRKLPSYQLAVVVDDHRQGVTQIIRGDDLLDSGARQLLLWRALDLSPEPTFTHLPLVLGEDGRRLAKRHGDTRVDYYRSHGVPAEAIIGLVAYWSGTLPQRETMNVREFMGAFKLSTIPDRPITFTQEDDRWLLSQAR
jgi:glutamyl-tRNA synthetase